MYSRTDKLTDSWSTVRKKNCLCFICVDLIQYVSSSFLLSIFFFIASLISFRRHIKFHVFTRFSGKKIPAFVKIFTDAKLANHSAKIASSVKWINLPNFDYERNNSHLFCRHPYYNAYHFIFDVNRRRRD